MLDKVTAAENCELGNSPCFSITDDDLTWANDKRENLSDLSAVWKTGVQ